MVLVSASDSTHFRSLVQFLSSVGRCDPGRRVIVFDLGLTAGQRRRLERRRSIIEVRKFNFAAYPPYFDIRVKAGEYAWKPTIVWDVLEDSVESVCWMDAGNVLVQSLDTLASAVLRHGFYSPYSPGTVGEWTHPKMLSYFGLPASWNSALPNLNGACIAFDPSNARAKALAREWRDGALVRECIAPEGSDRTNHRQDQALLTVLAYRAGMVEGMEHGYLGFKIHQDVETKRLRAAARAFKRWIEYHAARRG